MDIGRRWLFSQQVYLGRGMRFAVVMFLASIVALLIAFWRDRNAAPYDAD